MAKNQAPMSTNIVLIMLLMGIVILCLSALSLDYRHKNSLLRADVTRLESSQVLLMVPDGQAEAIATWLASHPEQTQLMLQAASDGHEAMTIGPAPIVKNAVPSLLEKHTSEVEAGMGSSTQEFSVPKQLQIPDAKLKQAEPNNAIVITENVDGVKVISLPNGGIRVTTREGQ